MAIVYRERLLDRVLADLIADFPAVMLVGPRASGKTTSAARLAKTVVRLDRERDAKPFRDDPDEVLRSLDAPMLIDEWQLVPDVLGAVKRAVDENAVGPILLTGSVRAELLSATWAATGRVVRLTQWGMCERELAGRADDPSFFDVVFDSGAEALSSPADAPALRGYVELAMRGMYPAVALDSADSTRRRWLGSYIDQLVMRDASLANEDRDPVRLRKYAAAVAANTAGVVEHKTLYDAAGVSRVTGAAYDNVLELLFAMERLPAWHSNRLNRLTRSPKRYLTDAALMRPLLGVDDRAVLRDGDLLGRAIDTFVVSQLRPEAEAALSPVRFSHLRQDNGTREVDLIAERDDGRLIAIEIKATAAPSSDDARHLVWLRDRLGAQMVCGIVFHTGPRVFRIAEGIHAVPIAAIWGPRSG